MGRTLGFTLRMRGFVPDKCELSLRGFKAGVGMIRTEFRKNSLLICGEFEPQEELGDLLATSAVMQV